MATEKVITYNTEIKLDWIEIDKGIAAYQMQKSINGELIQTSEGLAFIADLEQSKNGEDFVAPSLKIKDDNHLISLYPKTAKEELRKTVLSFRDNMSDFIKKSIENPYTYLKENGDENVFLIAISFGNYMVYDLDENPLPKAMYFDYMSGSVDNGSYDLKELLECLKKRTDIVPAPHKEAVEIISIPYYNADEYRNKQIEFVWVPTDEDFEILKPYVWHTTRFEKVIELVLGIERKPFEDEDED